MNAQLRVAARRPVVRPVTKNQFQRFVGCSIGTSISRNCRRKEDKDERKKEEMEKKVRDKCVTSSSVADLDPRHDQRYVHGNFRSREKLQATDTMQRGGRGVKKMNRGVAAGRALFYMRCADRPHPRRK